MELKNQNNFVACRNQNKTRILPFEENKLFEKLDFVRVEINLMSRTAKKDLKDNKIFPFINLNTSDLTSQ